MNSATSNFFMVSSNSGIVSPVLTSARIYPLVLKLAVGENENRIEVASLIRLAEIFHSRRDFAALEQIVQLLIATPHGQDAGIYYLALLEQKEGRFDSARSMLEPLTRYASPIIKARAQWSLAATAHLAGDISEATRGYIEAAQLAKNLDPLTLCTTQLQFSILRSQSEDHHGAIDHLNQAWPIIRLISHRFPHLFYGFHNDLSYELAEIGRIDQARKLSAIACNSPFVEKYPEWKATEQEIKQKREAAEHKPVIIIIQKPEPETQPEPVVVIPVPVICFHSPKSYNVDLRGSIYLTRAPASTLQLERIKYSITRRGPPQFSTP